MTSREVEDAVGAAPERESAAARLAATKQALADAEARLRDAELTDADALIAAQQVANRLREAVVKLQVEAQRETEVDARKEAAALVKTLATRYEDETAEFAARFEELNEQLRLLTPLVKKLHAAWSVLEWRRREVAILARRFEHPAPELSPLPDSPSTSVSVFEVATRSDARPSPQPIYGHIANMTPEQKHQADVVALAAYVKQFSRRLSPETRALFDKLPASEQAPPEDPERVREKTERLERQAREARRMQANVDAEMRARGAVQNVELAHYDSEEQQKLRELKQRQQTRHKAHVVEEMTAEKRRLENTTPGKGLRSGLQVPSTNKKGRK